MLLRRKQQEIKEPASEASSETVSETPAASGAGEEKKVLRLPMLRSQQLKSWLTMIKKISRTSKIILT